MELARFITCVRRRGAAQVPVSVSAASALLRYRGRIDGSYRG
jgi:hypothetical protein